MEIGYIATENLSAYRTLLLPFAAQALERGEPVTALGVSEDSLAVGAVAGYLEDSRFQIVSLYIAPDYRRRGGGRLLLQTLASLLPQVSAGGMAVNYTVTEPEHETLAPFLASMGFAEERVQGPLFFFTLKQASDSSFFHENMPSNSSVLPFSEVPKYYLAKADKQARAADIPMPPGTLDSDAFDRDLSTAMLGGAGVTAFLGFDRSCGGRLTISCIWNEGQDHSAVSALLRESFRLASRKYPPDTEIALQAVNDSSVRLARLLLPNARLVSRSYYRHADR